MSNTTNPKERRSRGERECRMAEYETGEHKPRAFCAQCGLAHCTFGYWSKQLRGAYSCNSFIQTPMRGTFLAGSSG
jgi:hypothetical protein